MKINEYHQYITPDGKVYDLHTASKYGRWVMQSSGWGMPPVEYITQRGTFQHGESVKDYFLQPRIIQLLINQSFCDREGLWNGRASLLDALRPNRQLTATGITPGTLRRILPDGTKRDLRVFITDGPSFDPDLGQGWRENSFKEVIRFIAHDPVIYDPDLQIESLEVGSQGFLQFYEDEGDSYVDCGQIHDDAAKLWISLKFRLDADWKLEDYIYIGGSTTQKVRKLLRSDLTHVAESASYGGIIFALAVDADYVFAGGQNTQTVRKLNKSDLSLAAESPDLGGFIYGLAVDDSHVYTAQSFNNVVSKLDKSDLSLDDESAEYGISIRAITQDGDYLYIGGLAVGDRPVRKIRKSDMATIADSDPYGGDIHAITHDETYLYVGGATTRKVYKLLKSDLSKVAESADYGGTIRGIVVDDNHVYVAGFTTRTIRKLLKSDLSQVAESAGYGGDIYALSGEVNFVYAGGATTRTVRKYAKSDLSQVAESGNYGGVVYAITSPVTPLYSSRYLLAKKIDDDNVLFIRLSKDNARLQFGLITAGAYDFSVHSAEFDWNADTWYHVLASISDAEGVRLRIDNGTAVTDADASPAPDGGDFVIGNSETGAPDGIQGVIIKVVAGNSDLTEGEEDDLYDDVYPASAENIWELNEGIGIVAEDTGPGGDDGDIGTANTWIVEVVTDLVEINYQGTWKTYPIINITGPLSDFTIENLSTDEKLEFNYNLLAGRVLTVNLAYGNKTVQDDLGNNLIGVLSTDSDLATFHIAPDPEVPGGVNTIRLSGSDGMDGETRVEIEYYTRYFGI